MSRLDDLPPDQHAALSLLLVRRKSFAEVATLLGIPEQAVRDRAHSALAVLAPRQARALTAERRAELGDYLLGQQAGMGDRLATRTDLEGSAEERAWASAVASELTALAGATLPEIPSAASRAEQERAPSPEPARPSMAGRAPLGARDATPGARPPAQAHHEAAPDRRADIRARSPLPSSRAGGALLLGAIVAGVIVAVILLTGGGGSSHNHANTTAASTSPAAKSASTKASGTSTSGKATEDKRIELAPPDPASKAIGVAEVLSEGKTYAFYLAAEHLPPSKGFFYAVWLYNSPTSAEALTRSPAVGSNGRLQGGALLPANAGNYHTMLLTRETSERPTTPGPVVLSGAFGLH
jgi:hypothetical protein